MNRALDLNPGAQTDFVHSAAKYAAFIGGIGSGKTYAGIARGLRLSLQPKPQGAYHAARGVIAASSYPVLKDVIIPTLQEIVETTGLADWSKDYKKSEKELTLINGSVVRLRSLDKPDWMRGPEYSWFFIDEGRNVNLDAWKVLTGRLRQKGYQQSGFVCSSPNGYDWMWRVFHDDSEDKVPGAVWYNAPTPENKHLPEGYLENLQANYHGRFYEQEVEGHFVGLVEGGVFPYWDPELHCIPLEYDPSLPFYTGWDFGFGDLGVCIFFQVMWREREGQYPGPRLKVPFLYVLDAIAEKEWTAADWARAYREALAGRSTIGDYGDPAGVQRNPSTGTSVIQDLNTAGVPVSPVSKRPQDYSLRILNNMMAGNRVFVAKGNADIVSQALASHKWKLGPDGQRTQRDPVHDWTSHIVDALRYGVSATLAFGPQVVPNQEDVSFEPNTYGYVFQQLLKKPDRPLLGHGRRARPTFQAEARPR